MSRVPPDDANIFNAVFVAIARLAVTGKVYAGVIFPMLGDIEEFEYVVEVHGKICTRRVEMLFLRLRGSMLSQRR